MPSPLITSAMHATRDIDAQHQHAWLLAHESGRFLVYVQQVVAFPRKSCCYIRDQNATIPDPTPQNLKMIQPYSHGLGSCCYGQQGYPPLVLSVAKLLGKVTRIPLSARKALPIF